MTIWQLCGDVYCDSCGETMWEAVKAEYAENQMDINPVMRMDSEIFPVPHCNDEDADDCPSHCGNGADCEEYIPMEDGSRIGGLLTSTLSETGMAYVTSAHRENPTLVSGLWMTQFEIPEILPDTDSDRLRDAIEELMVDAINPDETIIVQIGDERMTFYRAKESGIRGGFDAKPVPVGMFTGCYRETRDEAGMWDLNNG